MSQRALANQERELQMSRLKQSARAMLLLLATVLTVGTAGLLAADQLYRPDAFVIDQLKIKGHFRHLDPSAVEDIVKRHVVGNFFSVQLKEIEQRVEQLAWVQDAEVRREWPNTLLIHIKEQRPVMRWGDQAWVNSQGEVIELPNEGLNSASITLDGHPRDAGLMLEKSLSWKKILAENGLQMLGMTLSESHAYRLELMESGMQDSFELLLGRHEVNSRLTRFLMLYNTELRDGDSYLQRVDARYPDGLAIKQQKRPQDPLKEGSAGNEKANQEPIQMLASRGAQ